MRVSSQTTLYLDPDAQQQVELSKWTDCLVYWWTKQARADGQPPLRLRLMQVSSSTGKSQVWMVSNVLERNKLSLESASRFYRM